MVCSGSIKRIKIKRRKRDGKMINNYGFIAQDDGSDDLFIHNNENPRFQACQVGDACTYDIEWYERKQMWVATNFRKTAGVNNIAWRGVIHSWSRPKARTRHKAKRRMEEDAASQEWRRTPRQRMEEDAASQEVEAEVKEDDDDDEEYEKQVKEEYETEVKVRMPQRMLDEEDGEGEEEEDETDEDEEDDAQPPCTGTIRCFFKEKGFGIIIPVDGSDAVIAPAEKCPGIESAQPGDACSYDLAWNDRKGRWEANNFSTSSRKGRGKGMWEYVGSKGRGKTLWLYIAPGVLP
jgi:cold shock CspA family protein